MPGDGPCAHFLRLHVTILRTMVRCIDQAGHQGSHAQNEKTYQFVSHTDNIDRWRAHFDFVQVSYIWCISKILMLRKWCV